VDCHIKNGQYIKRYKIIRTNSLPETNTQKSCSKSNHGEVGYRMAKCKDHEHLDLYRNRFQGLLCLHYVCGGGGDDVDDNNLHFK
jgi:hypothetical protein